LPSLKAVINKKRHVYFYQVYQMIVKAK